MKRIILATKNRGKLREFQALFDKGTELLSLNDFPGMPEIIEDGRTFFENALKKARLVSKWTGEVSLADDSGLEVDALGARPGIYSARYSGPGSTDQANIEKLLGELAGISPELRTARFRCVLVLYYQNDTYDSVEGVLEGRIAEETRGSNGFGYDPVFWVPEYGKTVAEMSPDLKNRISHRSQALKKLIQKLGEQADS